MNSHWLAVCVVGIWLAVYLTWRRFPHGPIGVEITIGVCATLLFFASLGAFDHV